MIVITSLWLRTGSFLGLFPNVIVESANVNALQKSSERQYISVILESVKFIVGCLFVQTKFKQLCDFTDFLLQNSLLINRLLIELRLLTIQTIAGQ